MAVKTSIQVTVDLVIFALRDWELQVLLIRRGVPPFEGRWALPGGFVRQGESLEHAARRELEEETGVRDVYLEQLYTFGDADRDPRGRIVTVAYYALLTGEAAPLKAGTDAGAWRNRGVPVYGIYPYPITDDQLTRMHGNDENVSVEALQLGTELIFKTLVDVAAKN